MQVSWNFFLCVCRRLCKALHKLLLFALWQGILPKGWHITVSQNVFKTITQVLFLCLWQAFYLCLAAQGLAFALAPLRKGQLHRPAPAGVFGPGSAAMGRHALWQIHRPAGVQAAVAAAQHINPACCVHTLTGPRPRLASWPARLLPQGWLGPFPQPLCGPRAPLCGARLPVWPAWPAPARPPGCPRRT